jgi:Zn finger protein HypA/HybF involved in hydrogenase expression
LLEECDCGADWKQYQDELKASKVANTIYIFDCVDCRQFYGEQSLTPDGRLLCPSCYSEQVIESAFVEAVLAKSEVKPFTAGILCEDCAEPIERDGYETYCYKCDPTFEMNQ